MEYVHVLQLVKDVLILLRVHVGEGQHLSMSLGSCNGFSFLQSGILLSKLFFGLPKIKPPWTIVHGFRPENCTSVKHDFIRKCISRGAEWCKF